jgi:hypothetical protein
MKSSPSGFYRRRWLSQHRSCDRCMHSFFRQRRTSEHEGYWLLRARRQLMWRRHLFGWYHATSNSLITGNRAIAVNGSARGGAIDAHGGLRSITSVISNNYTYMPVTATPQRLASCLRCSGGYRCVRSAAGRHHLRHRIRGVPVSDILNLTVHAR